MNDPRALIPEGKQDVDTARRAVEAGWPAVEPVLPELVAWCVDGNWPVAKILAPFLGSLGTAASGAVREVLNGDDPTAAYFVITEIVGAMPPEGVESLADELRRIAHSPTPEEAAEEVPEVARVELARLR